MFDASQVHLVEDDEEGVGLLAGGLGPLFLVAGPEEEVEEWGGRVLARQGVEVAEQATVVDPVGADGDDDVVLEGCFNDFGLGQADLKLIRVGCLALPHTQPDSVTLLDV